MGDVGAELLESAQAFEMIAFEGGGRFDFNSDETGSVGNEEIDFVFSSSDARNALWSAVAISRLSGSSKLA